MLKWKSTQNRVNSVCATAEISSTGLEICLKLHNGHGLAANADCIGFSLLTAQNLSRLFIGKQTETSTRHPVKQTVEDTPPLFLVVVVVWTILVVASTSTWSTFLGQLSQPMTLVTKTTSSGQLSQRMTCRTTTEVLCCSHVDTAAYQTWIQTSTRHWLKTDFCHCFHLSSSSSSIP